MFGNRHLQRGGTRPTIERPTAEDIKEMRESLSSRFTISHPQGLKSFPIRQKETPKSGHCLMICEEIYSKEI